MFIRYVNDFKAYCKDVKVYVQKETYDLIKPNFDIEMYHEDTVKDAEYDYFIPFIDMFYIMGFNPDIPYKEGYIKIPNGNNPLIHNNDKFKIGISFEGNPDSLTSSRDIPLEKLYPLLDIPNVEVYSFQKGDVYHQLDKADKRIIKLGDSFNDWNDTAIAMGKMDLMISTDNGILNLAGALGINTYGIFNRYVDFRWFDLSDDVTWYKIKPYQCTIPNGWDDVVKRIVDDVKYNRLEGD